MIGGLKTKQQHNINLINEILKLNIPQITAAVRNAIHKYNIFDGPTNTDLLYIVFECLNSYLENLNLQHVRSNEPRLIKEINQIGQILQIVNVGTYLQYVDYRFRISNVISPKVSDKMVSLTLSGVYLEAEKVFRNHDKQSYSKILSLITSVTRVTNETAENALSANQLNFWFQDVIPLMFDSEKDIQNSAIKAVEAVLPFFQLSSYQEHPNWPAVERLITTEYSDLVIVLRDKGDSVWYRTWNVMVKVLNKKLLKGSVVINKFLAICEHGFKSSNFTTRAETFLCWKVLLEIYSKDSKYLSAKRIKLLLIPFKPIAKTPEIAMNKFLVWWSLICKVENQIDQHYDAILVPFLCFCFGLSDKPILSAAVEGVTRQEVYPQLTMLSVTALINLLGPVSDVTSSLCKSVPIERIHEPLLLPSLLENVGRFLINACGEATFLMKDIGLVNAIPVCKNLWSNLMNRMEENNDPTLTELIVQNLTILANASQNDEPAKKLINHVAIIALSSKNLIPTNISDDNIFAISKRISLLLTNDIIHINDNALKGIVDNVFTLSSDSEKLQHFQHILTLLQSQKFSSNVRVGTTIWIKTANYIVNLTQNIDKDVIYGYIEWLVKYSKVDQLSVFLTTWKNLARCLMINDPEGLFWTRIDEILRLIITDTDGRICKFVATVFGLINPAGTVFPSKFKSLVEDVVNSTQLIHVEELQPIIDEINKFSELILGEHSAATYKSLNELVVILEKKSDLGLRNQFGVFNQFRKNIDQFSKNNKSKEKTSKSKDSEFVFIPSTWQFRPEKLTEHQQEKLKEKRVDIPALYNDMSQSQDSHSISLKPWTPNKQLQPNVAECQINEATEPSDCMKSTDNKIDELQSTHSDSMTSTTLDTDQESISTHDVSQQTLNKSNPEERKRKRLQSELNKLQLSLKNADQYSQVQGRTRRMSINIVKSEPRLRKRSQTEIPKPTPPKRTKKIPVTSRENSESESNEIIEASQTMVTTPTSRRTRQTKNTSIKVNTQQVDESLKKSAEKDKTDDRADNVTKVSNSRPIEEPVTQEIVDDINNQSEAATLDITPNTKKDESPDTQTDVGETGKVDNVNVSLVENRSTVVNIASYAEISTTSSEEVAIPQENTEHKPIEDAKSEVAKIVSEDIALSPVADEDEHLTQISGGIITSPSSNKNCSKTTELLNSTVDISPIPHAKGVSADRTSESKSNQQSSTKHTECCLENIEIDQIKRTELDNLIKQPIDSPILQDHKVAHGLAYSTPQSPKDPKRKFALQGRGAQLLQLMNIRKIEDVASPKAKTPIHISETTTAVEITTPNSKQLRSYEDILASNKDLFRFSKVLPSPRASPSNSIMKRNLNEVTDMEDIESSNQKRKRVSFHDPPVSATKEFIRFAEEINPNRGRIIRNNLSSLSGKTVLIRKGRSDSLNEIKKFSLSCDDVDSDKSSMKSLKWNSDDDDEEMGALPPLITFSNKSEVLQHVFEEYSMEDILSKYFESGFTLNDASSKIMANHLTNVMKNNENERKYILEDLSEKFPKEFLGVALQENLTSTVIERLQPITMLNYITDQAKIDDNLKMQMMDKFASTIADTSSTRTEMKDDLYKILLEIISHKMSDTQLLDVLDVLFEKRRTNS